MTKLSHVINGANSRAVIGPRHSSIGGEVWDREWLTAPVHELVIALSRPEKA